MCAHVQIHTDVLEAICTTYKLLESKAEPSWSQLDVKCSCASNMSIIPVSFQCCPCRCLHLSTVGSYVRHFSIYIALVNIWGGELNNRGPIKENCTSLQTDLASQISSNSRGSCESVTMHINFWGHSRNHNSFYASSEPLNSHLGSLIVTSAFCLLIMD